MGPTMDPEEAQGYIDTFVQQYQTAWSKVGERVPGINNERFQLYRKLMKAPHRLNKCRCKGVRRILPNRDTQNRTWEDMYCLDFFEQWGPVQLLGRGGNCVRS